MHAEKIEEEYIKMCDEDFLNYMFSKNFLRREMMCPGTCQSNMKLCSAVRYSEGVAWRCFAIGCSRRHSRVDVRKHSFFSEFGIELKKIFKILLRWAGGQTQSSILSTIQVSKPTLIKLIKKLVGLMALDNERQPKLGGPGSIVQVDETMLNYKCKSHRGRSPNNRTDALCIVECMPKIQKVWAQIIPDKRAVTIVPIICDRVIENSIIHTDEHRSYTCLSDQGFTHNTICHKYNFVDQVNGTNTQCVESFNNQLKLAIKTRKGVKTELRAEFLSEFIWRWNNKKKLIDAIFDLIKI